MAKKAEAKPNPHDLDRGQGDEERFSAEDLERLYLSGGVDGSAKIQGKVLNQVLNVTCYDSDRWYLLTHDRIVPWED